MQKEELLQYYGYLSRFALSKCESQPDAEDLVSETMLAAFAHLHKGGAIEYPKTWLSHTFMHKFHDHLRKKYQSPLTVNLDLIAEIPGGENGETPYAEGGEAADVRRELNYLAKTTREVLIRYYFNNHSVADIARALQIPEGTVKSRLYSGRNQMKKGLKRVETTINHIPGYLNLSFSGSGGTDNKPISFVEGDLIAQNLLALAYDKPLKIIELANAIGIPAAYVERIVERLTEGELMARTDGEKFYTDFIIYKPEDIIAPFEAQRNFVDTHFDVFWGAMSQTIQSVNALAYSKGLHRRRLQKLERYAVMRVLQNFEIEGGGKGAPQSPARKDGGAWTAMGHYFPAGYDTEKYDFVTQYQINGGHRTSSIGEYLGASRLTLCEFDTTLWDSPRRFHACGFDHYFTGIINLLWCVYKNADPNNNGIQNAVLESIPKFKTLGLLADEDGKLAVDIPVLHQAENAKLAAIIKHNQEVLIAKLGSSYQKFLQGAAVPVPPHLKSVPAFLRFSPATRCIAMSAVRKAYEKKLHLHDVDYCCPPVILVYEE